MFGDVVHAYDRSAGGDRRKACRKCPGQRSLNSVAGQRAEKSFPGRPNHKGQAIILEFAESADDFTILAACLGEPYTDVEDDATLGNSSVCRNCK